jgi:hypothetical protein
MQKNCPYSEEPCWLDKGHGQSPFNHIQRWNWWIRLFHRDNEFVDIIKSELYTFEEEVVLANEE